MKAFLYRVCAIFFSHFVLYPDYRISFFIPLAFRFADYNKDCARAKGKVILTFRVDKEGRPQDITVKKGLCASADEEAIRLIEEGPDWTMGEEPVEISIRF